VRDKFAGGKKVTDKFTVRRGRDNFTTGKRVRDRFPGGKKVRVKFTVGRG
jgi:hypothetical protein